MTSPRDRLTHPAALLGLTTLALVGAATATPWDLRLPTLALDLRPDLDTPTTSPAPTPSAAPTEPTPPDDTLVTLLLVLAGLVLALLLWWAGRRLLTALRDTPPSPHEPDQLDPGHDLATTQPALTVPELTDAVTRALAHLDDATTPTDGVIAAWVALEEAAAHAGTTRDPAQTTTEFTTAVLATTPAPAPQLTTLRTLYQHARFTHHPVTDDDVTTARTALTTIARTLDEHP
ncbi:uncharacterized protein DUF4129 [Isoptericola jiangsuensis]|uniref:Uncharacterized protein DUF4129 n=1 Tax=Isoptericola jiangsuensis TaxID=548579 RepID=A0A2A9EYF1_9MICO|nr:DUF4129 domain-containing protein [Isoptericola jiangsuensis]PFG43189.1 uncharacterized protein DUF4129 [Isoptericola jiangsuensis]